MGFLTWLGRIFWWIVFWPIGLWRSIAHARKKDQRRYEEAVVRAVAHTHPESQVTVIHTDENGLPEAPR